MVSTITEYVSYFEAGEDMTDEEYGQYMRAIHKFAYKDIEPDYSKLTPLVKAALRTVIASVRKNKEDRGNGSRGGRPRVSVEEKAGFLENKKGGYFSAETNDKDNVNANENVNVNENGNGKDNGAEAPFGSPPQEDFSQKAFEIFKDAGLPCCEGNYLSFLQRDFKLGLPYLRGYSTREALEACQNYASIFQKSSTDAFWRKQKVAFDKFCERKIRDFLPGNFVPEKYEKATREDRRGL